MTCINYFHLMCASSCAFMNIVHATFSKVNAKISVNCVKEIHRGTMMVSSSSSRRRRRRKRWMQPKKKTVGAKLLIPVFV